MWLKTIGLCGDTRLMRILRPRHRCMAIWSRRRTEPVALLPVTSWAVLGWFPELVAALPATTYKMGKAARGYWPISRLLSR
jgi:hypothetical protein